MIAFLPCKFQLHCLEKSGRQITKMVSYCAYHRYKIFTSVISLFSFPVFSLTCAFIQHLVQWGQCLGLDYPVILLYKQLFFRCLQLLPLFMVSSYYLQGTKSRYSFDCTNSSWGIFCQKPSPK